MDADDLKSIPLITLKELCSDKSVLIAILDNIVVQLDRAIGNAESELPDELAVHTTGMFGTDKDFPVLAPFWDLSLDIERMLENLRAEGNGR